MNMTNATRSRFSVNFGGLRAGVSNILPSIQIQFNRIALLLIFTITACISFNGTANKGHYAFHTTHTYLGEAPGTITHRDARDMLDGTADRPFVFRRLLPDIANTTTTLIAHALPVQWQQPAHKVDVIAPHTLLHSPLINHPFLELGVEFAINYGLKYDIIYAVNLITAHIIIWILWRTCQQLGFSQISCVCAPILFMLILPFLENGGSFFYDYPEIAFFALAVYFAMKAPWWALFPITFLGTWNKESFLLFLPTLYPFLRARYGMKNSLFLCGLMSVLAGTIYLHIRAQYAMNGGGMVEFHLYDQMQYALNPLWHLDRWEYTYGTPLLSTYIFLPFFTWTVVRGWNNLPQTAKRHAQLALLINLPLYILFCSPGETRNLSMLYIAFTFLIASNISLTVKNDHINPQSMNY